ncbi:MAG: acyl-CoA dehydrogenase family protein, partial [Yoonia sp.]
MPYRAPITDYRFIMDHIAGFTAVAQTERFAEATADMADAILTEAGKLCEDVLYPINRNGDLTPAALENGIVRTSPGFGDAYHAIADGGWIGMSASTDAGGMGLPMALTTAVNEMMASGCLSLQLNPLMTQGQIEALEHHASDEIKETYLPHLISGAWS